jgi:hypothetical protein
MMRIIEGHDYHFPVIGYDRKGAYSEVVFTPKNVYGTAFNIGEDYFMTAGHSLKSAASENDTIAIGFVDGQDYLASEVLDYEIVPEFDVGFIKVMARIDRAKGLEWEHKRIASLLDVGAMGHPYALDPESHTLGSRSFKGYIVSRRRFHGFPAKPWIYELSFQCPRGLSGAAVITLDGSPKIVGMVVGNHTTKMLVFSDSERISESKETIVERYEALQLGIALQSTGLLTINSRILKGTLSNHLKRYGLLGEAVIINLGDT